MKRTLGTLAYLGPEGSYTHAAVLSCYSVDTLVPCSSITRVFEAVANAEVEWGCIPLENMLEGPVSESLDCLLARGGTIQITDSCNFRIDHCLGVLSASYKDTDGSSMGSADTVEFSEIQSIYSHGQALSQCADFLDTHLPDAKRIACTSTAAAAQRVVTEQSSTVAAIASAETLSGLGLKVIAEQIAKQRTNKTRFAIICRQDNAGKWERLTAASSFVTSISLDPSRDRQGILHEVLEVVSREHRCNLLSIHSRPDQRGGFVFYLDLEGSQEQPHIASALDALSTYCREVTGATAVLTCFGSYAFEAFHSLPFSTIGVIGADGAMGTWFCDFFQSLGLATLGVDRDSSLSLETLVNSSDAVVISVPMSEMENISKQLATLVRPGQLIVENASIKNSSLPLLEAALPNSVELLGIHTMFGPQPGLPTTDPSSQGSARHNLMEGSALKKSAERLQTRSSNIRGQNIIITKTKTSGPKAQAFEDILYKQGALLAQASPEAHDRASATLQAMIHLLLISTASVLEDEWKSVETLEPFTTPNARPLLEAMRRVVAQPDSLLTDMQLLNPHSEAIRHKLLSVLFRLVFTIDQGGTKELDAALNDARSFFGLTRNTNRDNKDTDG